VSDVYEIKKKSKEIKQVLEIYALINLYTNRHKVVLADQSQS
jgi:hypothetical protein